MMEKLRDILKFAAIIIAMMFVWSLIHQVSSCTNRTTTYDTITVYDTVIMPMAKDSTVIRYQISKLPIIKTEYETDTIFKTDSIEVEVPISQKVYEDSTYKAVISGFNTSLDSIYIKNKYITKTITNTKTKPTKWGLGATAGYDPINRNFGVVIGVQFNIIPLK